MSGEAVLTNICALGQAGLNHEPPQVALAPTKN